MSNLAKLDLFVLACLAVVVFFMFASTRYAHGQYYPYGWPAYTQPQAPTHRQHTRNKVHVRAHFRSAPSPKRQRSATEWKASIMAQGKAYCRAHPGDKICPH